MKESVAIIEYLQSLENIENQAGMKRFAIGNNNTLGVSMPVLRTLAKEYNKNPARHEIAMELWKSNIHEAMILASMLAIPQRFTAKEMDAWTHVFYSWDLCDQVCGNLFQKTNYFIEKAFEYAQATEPFVKRTGFVLMVQYTVHHKKADDALCLQFLDRIEAEAWDNRNFVKKALNWCLRQIGKRNAYLHPIALACAYRIRQQGSAAARWIASGAIKELESEAVLKRLKLA
jgi:3-methyladenine DNA glycosylase AlkD